MGCCISANRGAPGSASKNHKQGGSDEASSQLKKGFSHGSRAPPPPPSIDQEETVKEVLSETPKPKPRPNPDPIFSAHMKQDLQQQRQQQEKEAKISDSPRKVEAFANNVQDKQNLSSSNEEEIMSQVSEICSVSVSESLSTMTNVTDMRDIEEGEQEVRPRPREIARSPAKPRPTGNGFKGDRVVNQSPTRRSDQSPARRIGSGSPVQIRDSGRVKCPRRRDPGECSGRRSRSPATTTRSSAFMGRSPSARRTNRSPGRARSVPIENTTKCTTSINHNNNNSSSSTSGAMEGGKWPSHNNNDINDHCSSTNESLENPLVSLECFIFL